MRGAAAVAVGPGLVLLLAELFMYSTEQRPWKVPNLQRNKWCLCYFYLYIFIVQKKHNQTGVSNVVQGGMGAQKLGFYVEYPNSFYASMQFWLRIQKVVFETCF